MKKVISMILTSVMAVSALSVSAGAVDYGAEYANQPTKTYTQKFNDVPTSHWAFSYIGEMTEREVVSGYPNGNFYPDNNVTRAEFARIMTSASGLKISTPTQRDFSDVATDAWYAPYIHAAYPYLSGYQIYGGSYYKPDTPALREDIAVALVKLKGYDTLGADESLLTTMFTDASSISGDARKYVAVALERGLVSGYEDNTFRGQASISRAEATAMLWRAYQYGNDNKTFDNLPTTAPITPTAAPIATQAPAPVETEKPVVTAAPTERPTPEPTEAPQEKPYIMDTVTKANISSEWDLMTSDNSRYVYYIDNGSIYSVDMEKEKVSKLYNLSDLKMTEDDEVTLDDVDEETSYYLDFNAEQLLYDTENDRLFCKGYFNSFRDWKNLSPDGSYEYALIELSDEDIELSLKDEDIKDFYHARLLCGMNNGVLFGEIRGDGWGNHDTQYTLYNIGEKEKELQFINGWISIDSIDNNRMRYLHYFANNGLYVIYQDVFEGGAAIDKYNFTSQKFEDIQSLKSAEKTGYHNGKFYGWDIETGQITECALNGKLTLSDVNTKENVDILDFKNISEKAGRMFVSDSGKIVFYDNTSIRVIKER